MGTKRIESAVPKRFFPFNLRSLCYDTVVRLRGISKNSESKNQHEFRSEKNLAVAILRQAWHEAVIDLRHVKETSRKDYRLLKKKAIEWISSDDDGFPYWCKLADVDHCAVRQKLSATLKRQRIVTSRLNGNGHQRARR